MKTAPKKPSRKKRFMQPGEITKDQIYDIAQVLKKRGVHLDENALDRLAWDVGTCLEYFSHTLVCESDKYWKKRNTRANVLQRIENLKAALTALPESAVLILNEAQAHTPTQAALEKAGVNKSSVFEQAALHAEDASFQIPGLSYLALNALIESCEIALQPSPPNMGNRYTDKNIVDYYTGTSKGGQPRNVTEQRLVSNLAIVFEDHTGTEPTDTEGGAFDDFLSACMMIIEPDRNAQEWKSNRKLIRASLSKYNNVP